MGSNTKPKDTRSRGEGRAHTTRVHIGEGEFRVVSFENRAPAVPTSLSAAERDIALRLAAGAKTAEIAAARGVSERTVQTQLRRIFKKLGVSSQTALLALLHHRAD